ncbi:MAG: hypothetical protein AB1592_12880 [Pseudomonadota bacterium]
MSNSLPLPQSERRSGPYVASSGQVAFSVTFPFLAAGDLAVQTRPTANDAWTTRSLSTEYSVSGVANPSGGAITFVTPPGTGVQVQILGLSPVASQADVTPAGQISSTGINRMYDRVVIWVQEIRRDATEALNTVLAAMPLLVQVAPAVLYMQGALAQVLALVDGIINVNGKYRTVAGMLVSLEAPRNTGDIWEAQGFRYQQAPANASDHHVTTAGGVKLYGLPDADGFVSIEQFGAVAEGADHSAALAAAWRASPKVRLGAGTWRFSYVSGPDKAALVGLPGQTIIRPTNVDDRAAITWDSGSASASLRNIHLRGLIVQGDVETAGFSEQKHLITLNGVDGVLIEDSKFIGFRGDGLYFGSGDSGGTTERHNRNVFITRTIFDGVNRDNRNAISFIDIDGVWIYSCYFIRCTRPNMPGPIDLEPNSNAFHVLKDIWIYDNMFIDCGGATGLITVAAGALVTSGGAVPRNINILHNKQQGSYQSSNAGFTRLTCGVAPTATSDDMMVTIAYNHGVSNNGLGSPMAFTSVKGVRSYGNVWENYGIAAQIGGLTSASAVRDIKIADKFIRCGNTVDSAIDVFLADYVDFSGSIFDDCADGTSNASAVNFKSGSSSYVKLNDITVVSPTSKTKRVTLKDGGHTFAPSTNECFHLNSGTLAIDFQAEQSDVLWTSYTPIVEGSSSAGTGTYTVQFGRYRRRGKDVRFEVEIAQTDHTGTGLIEISLPTLAAPVSGNRQTLVPLLIDGVTSTGGQVGAINPAATAGGLGCVRAYATGAGTTAQIGVPTGAATYRTSGVYTAP